MKPWTIYPESLDVKGQDGTPLQQVKAHVRTLGRVDYPESGGIRFCRRNPGPHARRRGRQRRRSRRHRAIKPGDTVKFLATDRGHNAATIVGMIPGESKKFIGKIDQEIEVTLTESGIWGVKCSPHYTMGMVMLIQVGDTAATEADLSQDLPADVRKRMLEILARHDAGK